MFNLPYGVLLTLIHDIYPLYTGRYEHLELRGKIILGCNTHYRVKHKERTKYYD